MIKYDTLIQMAPETWVMVWNTNGAVSVVGLVIEQDTVWVSTNDLSRASFNVTMDIDVAGLSN